MDHSASLLYLHERATAVCPKPDKSSPQLTSSIFWVFDCNINNTDAGLLSRFYLLNDYNLIVVRR
jgi:hypothetical protein